MTIFDDKPGAAPEPSQLPADTPASPDSATHISGDPIAHAAEQPAAPAAAILPAQNLPEDLRISWSWSHFVLFLFFGMVSFALTQLGAGFYLASQIHGRRVTAQELQKILISRPEVPIGANLLLFALIFLFLYVTVAVLNDRPFWRSLGWRKLVRTDSAPANPWLYFFAGVGLAIGVALVSSRIETPDHMPIQDLFKNRTGAILLMSMAVLVAPLVEETVFRGYLYPLFAKSFGITPGIVVTGVLFGLMHGAQLGWTWGLVGMLSVVGLIFTFTRARTGTVVASFLMHLGYNSLIAVSMIIATRGFTHVPLRP
jgi:membrane protease YdiL (CAAX protease family)